MLERVNIGAYVTPWKKRDKEILDVLICLNVSPKGFFKACK